MKYLILFLQVLSKVLILQKLIFHNYTGARKENQNFFFLFFSPLNLSAAFLDCFSNHFWNYGFKTKCLIAAPYFALPCFLRKNQDVIWKVSREKEPES